MTLQVLVLSELFPRPPRPTSGVFVERQVSHLRPFCEQRILVPIRVFPHTGIWRQIKRPQQFKQAWQRWWQSLQQIPAQALVSEIPTFYPRYTSLPKPMMHGLLGFAAYPFVHATLKRLYQEQPFDLIHAHVASPCGVIALLARRWLKVPVVLSIHGADVYYVAQQNRLGQGRYAGYCHKWRLLLLIVAGHAATYWLWMRTQIR